MQRIASSEISQMIVTDTVPIDPLVQPAKVTVLTVSKILAESIRNVFSDESVSSIFGGENQLF
jgi:ribose-phosphate pyrophosphokinase